jgi:hypothetical protein
VGVQLTGIEVLTKNHQLQLTGKDLQGGSGTGIFLQHLQTIALLPKVNLDYMKVLTDQTREFKITGELR